MAQGASLELSSSCTGVNQCQSMGELIWRWGVNADLDWWWRGRAAGCLCPGWEVWAVGPLLTCQTDCLLKRLPSCMSKGPEAGPLLPSTIQLSQSCPWKEASLRVQFGAICAHCTRPWVGWGQMEGDTGRVCMWLAAPSAHHLQPVLGYSGLTGE